MTLLQMQKNISVHCATCGHFRTRHVKGFGCLVCDSLIRKGWRLEALCRESFTSRLPQSEIDQALKVAKNSHDGKERCASCLEIWWAHDGALCPNGETLFIPLIGD